MCSGGLIFVCRPVCAYPVHNYVMVCFLRNLHENPDMTPSDNTGKVLTQRIQARDRTTVLLTYSTRDANELRRMAQSITLKAGKKPSLSLFARRALQVYGSYLKDSRNAANEAAVLDRMVTPVPSPAPRSKRKAL